MGAPQKPQLGWDELSGLALVAKQIDQMPVSPEKAAMQQRYHDAFNQVLEHYDMPAREVSGRQQLLGLGVHGIDYGSGLVRTGVGEAGLAAKAGVDAVRGAPSSWSAGDALERAGRALNPFDRPALSSDQYMEMGGVPEMGRIADIEGHYPLTGREAIGFGLDAVMSPAHLKEGLASLFGKAPLAAAERPPIPASVMREAEEAARKDAGRNVTPGWGWSGVRDAAKGAGAWVIDPLTQLQQAMLKYRFKDADNALGLAASGGGKVPTRKLPSQIFQERGSNAITSGQLRQDARAYVNQNSDTINHMVGEMPEAGDVSIMRGTPQMAEMHPDLRDRRAAMAPLYSPEQQARERTPFIASDAQAARKEIEREYRDAATADPGLQRILDERIAKEGRIDTDPNGEFLRNRHTEPTLPGVPVLPQTTVRIKGLTKTGPGEYLETTRPLSINQDAPFAEVPRLSADPLSVDEPIGLPKISQMAGAAQGKAAERNFYLTRDRFASDSPQTPVKSREALAAEGALYAESGQHLRRTQEDLMDQVRPGAGGDVHRINQESSSLLEGMPYIDRPKPTPSSGKPTSRSRLAFGGAPMAALDSLSQFSKLGSMAGYQALRSPWVRRGALPAARAYMLDDYWQRQMNPTVNSEGMPGGDNPWALIYKYGGQQ